MAALLKQRLQINPFAAWVVFLGCVFATGLVGMGIVFVKGLSVTNLTDLVPWGLWITIDLSSIALSAGAFLLCAAVYLMGLKQFQPVARTATFIGLVGYSMAVMTLLMDIGRPDRFWHALVFWNPHSVLWEVTMCVTLYFSVLLLETIPIVAHADWFEARWPKLSHLLGKIHHLAPFLAILGLGFSMLHQSSLGATYGVIKARPIWYRPNLSVLFMVSAMAAGPAFTALVTMIAGRVSKKVYVNDVLVEKLAVFIGWVLVGYLYFRFWDAFAMTYTYQPGKTEGLALLTGGNLSFNFWVGEILVGAAVPMILLLNKRTRAIPWLRMTAFAMIVGGLVAYRWDTNLAGQIILLSYLPNDITARYTAYVPSLVEFIAGAGVIAYGMLAITMGVRFLNIVDHRIASEEEVVVHEPLAAAAD